MTKIKDKVEKWFVRDEKVLITTASTTELVNKAIKIHKLTPTTTAVLGRCLTMSVLMSAKLSHDNANITSIIDGGGPVGKIICVAKKGANVKGYIQNPLVNLELKQDGKLNVSGAVGTKGKLKVVMDLGFGYPYSGEVDLVSGEIAEDFVQYYYTSLQQPCAIALGVLVGPNNKCIVARGILIEIMPNAEEEDIAYVEKVIESIKDFTKEMKEETIEDFIHKNFPDAISLQCDLEPKFKCSCSKYKVKTILRSMKKEELETLYDENDEIKAHCDFCNKDIILNREDLN